jgi:hypothetical protein
MVTKAQREWRARNPFHSANGFHIDEIEKKFYSQVERQSIHTASTLGNIGRKKEIEK